MEKDALMMAPRASSRQTSLIRYILETRMTPIFADSMTAELVMMERSEVVPAMSTASIRLRPFRISSWKRVDIRMA